MTGEKLSAGETGSPTPYPKRARIFGISFMGVSITPSSPEALAERTTRQLTRTTDSDEYKKHLADAMGERASRLFHRPSVDGDREALDATGSTIGEPDETSLRG